jgi:hypothetical protein
MLKDRHRYCEGNAMCEARCARCVIAAGDRIRLEFGEGSLS